LLTRDKTLGGFLYSGWEWFPQGDWENIRTYLSFSSSIALSNFSTASSNLCWSNKSSPLQTPSVIKQTTP
jgi:hypothetical protein